MENGIRGSQSQRTEGMFPLLLDALKPEGRQHLKGARANANFKINLTTLPDQLHKLCLISFDSSCRDLSNGVKCFA